MNFKEQVLLVTEGTYPFKGGGVSTWTHLILKGLHNFDFKLYSLTANYETHLKYELPSSVINVFQVPLWSPDEPIETPAVSIDHNLIIKRKEKIIHKNIREKFLPDYEIFLRQTFSENWDEESTISVSDSMIKMWSFFRDFDYKNTMSSELVWNCFKSVAFEKFQQEMQDEIKLIDLTTAHRLLYRYLMPLGLEVPRSNITHLTVAGTGIIPALVNKQQCSAPILLTEHGVYIRERMLAISKLPYSDFLKRLLIRFSEMLTRITYANADIITTVSLFNVSWAKRYGADPSKIRVVHNGVDHQKFKPQIKGATGRAKYVVAAARIFDLKDIETMIRCCNETRKVIPDVKFLIYGDKDADLEYTDRCEKLIEQFNLTDNFYLAGFHQHPEKLYQEGLISILTSISEGFPFTVIESMSCGIPVVATDVGGVSEAIRDGITGFVCKPRDFKGIAEKVIRLLTSEEERLQMGHKAREDVIKRFTVEKFILDFTTVYSSLLHPKRRAEPSRLQNDDLSAKEKYERVG